MSAKIKALTVSLQSLRTKPILSKIWLDLTNNKKISMCGGDSTKFTNSLFVPFLHANFNMDPKLPAEPT